MKVKNNSKMNYYSRRVLDPLEIQRDQSINEYYRDYSPGDVQIFTPALQFPGLNLKQVHNMFDLNHKLLRNQQYKEEVSRKYRSDTNFNPKKNAYHLMQSQTSQFSLQGLHKKPRPARPKIDTSKYSVKTKKNSKSIFEAQKTLDYSGSITHQKRNRNHPKMSNHLTHSYNQVLGEELSKSTGFQGFPN
jgi:hypothetical protein